MQISKWGNSLAVRLPAALVEKMNLKEGDHVEIVPAGRKRMTIGRQNEIDALFEDLRKFRGRVPAGFKFDREGWKDASRSATLSVPIEMRDDESPATRPAISQAAHDAQASADAIDAAVYDIRAVNPRTRALRDDRTSVEILESIASHGRAVDAALTRLEALLAVGPAPLTGD